MKKNTWFKIGDLPVNNPIQERLMRFYDANYLPHEIAAITGFKEKDIIAIAKGKYIPYNEDRKEWLQIFDEHIERLNVKAESSDEATIYDGPCPEADLDVEGKVQYKLDVTSVSIYKGTDDPKMVIVSLCCQSDQ
jgi:hypothetical protein